MSLNFYGKVKIIKSHSGTRTHDLQIQSECSTQLYYAVRKKILRKKKNKKEVRHNMGVSDATFRKFHLRFCVPQEEEVFIKMQFTP